MNELFVDFEVVEMEEFQDEFVYDLSVEDDTISWFFANDMLIHNSDYLSFSWVKKLGIKLKDGNKISKEFYNICDEVESQINVGMNEWAKKSLRSQDPRFVFKREAICDSGIFLGPKYYVLHILDDEGVPSDKFKYKGVDVVKTTMPKALKPYVKKIIENMVINKSLKESNDLFTEAYNTFQSLGVESIYKNCSINNYEKYANKCNGFTTCKGMPSHVKAAYYHDLILDKLDISSNYEKFRSGDKVKMVYLKQPNKFGIDIIGFKSKYPVEFNDELQIDYEKMFNKIMYAAIERFYEAVGWKLRKPNENVRVELEDLFN